MKELAGWWKQYGGLARGECLNIGCALNKEESHLRINTTQALDTPRWTNLDMNPAVKPDVVFNLSSCRGRPMPFEDHQFDFILASHVLEHIERGALFPVFSELHRILKPGGYLLCILPHGASDDGWENPHHLSLWSTFTFHYFFHQLYTFDHAGKGATQGERFGNWQMVEQTVVPFPEFQQETPLWRRRLLREPTREWKLLHYRNTIQEVHTVLRAV